MADQPKKSRTITGRRGDPVSLVPLKPEQALAALLAVKPADIAKLEAEQGKAKPKPKK